MQEIFISYSSKDHSLAENICNYLNENGFSVWWDQELRRAGGSQWTLKITNAIENCRVFLVIITPASSESNHVLTELHLAMDCDTTIIPIMSKDFEIPKSFKYLIAGKQRVFSNHSSFFEDLNKSLSNANLIPSEPIKLYSVSLDKDGSLLKVHNEKTNGATEERLCIPAKNTIHLIEDNLIHSCPDDERHHYKLVKFLEPRDAKGLVKTKYKIKKVVTFDNLQELLPPHEGLDQLEKAKILLHTAESLLTQQDALTEIEGSRFHKYVDRNTHWQNNRYYFIAKERTYPNPDNYDGREHFYLPPND